MHSTRIALYDIKSGSFDDVVGKAKTGGLITMYKSNPGFLSLGVAQVAKETFVSVSTWETRQQADMATGKVADWVKSNAHETFSLRQNYVGDLAIDTAGELVGTVR